ncbi:DUF6927 domain-containing protein [Mycolicibacterium frederiksbergense]|uniref:DUF6927 domain-containing protein n=1 Tax=Mycolicibacterium frederiksbergense TaxID=117567 RepID=A0A6H0RX82_9MYCO|nr:hypothetical protein [Mycolicibacterium frederiksbergense]QIV79516.1 hypothetical protein EXE63_00240 [Mycolicibacterium frederiksbergense]
MGSISYAIPHRSSARAEVAQHVRGTRAEVIASNSAPGDGYEWGGTYFAAHREESGQVWASITLFAQYRGDVVIKMMDETMGPTALGVGATVLAALTEPEGDYARQWRQEAAHYQQQRAAALAARGRWITLQSPVTLQSGTVIDTVQVDSLRLWTARSGRKIRPNWDWFMSTWSTTPHPG